MVVSKFSREEMHLCHIEQKKTQIYFDRKSFCDMALCENLIYRLNNFLIAEHVIRYALCFYNSKCKLRFLV